MESNMDCEKGKKELECKEKDSSEINGAKNEGDEYVLDLANKMKEIIQKSISGESSVFQKSLLKSLVSKKKYRFEYDGFDLDLTYITENIIAMGFPSGGVEGWYRNGVDDVIKFFDKRHSNHYKVYNLCSERTYPENTFFQQECFPFDDHEAPPMQIMAPFCEDVHKWLTSDSANIAAIHCKAGKGRTGTMICAYLLYSQYFTNAKDALKFYGLMRTENGKGVTIPSQIRYVYYYEKLLKSKIDYPSTPPTLLITKFKIFTVPHQKCYPYFKIENDKCLFNYKKHYKPEKFKKQAFIELKANNFTVEGDVKVTFFNKKTLGKEKLFAFWFNTFFVPGDGVLTIKKKMLDKAVKDKDNKIFDSNFKIEVHYIILDEKYSVMDKVDEQMKTLSLNI